MRRQLDCAGTVQLSNRRKDCFTSGLQACNTGEGVEAACGRQSVSHGTEYERRAVRWESALPKHLTLHVLFTLSREKRRRERADVAALQRKRDWDPFDAGQCLCMQPTISVKISVVNKVPHHGLPLGTVALGHLECELSSD